MGGSNKNANPLRIADKRLLILLIFFLCLGVALGARITWLQAVESPKLRKVAIDQRLRKIDLPATRGRILDRNGEELATSKPVRAVFATPYQVEDAKAAAGILAAHLKLDKIEVEKKLRRKSGFVYIARFIPVEIADAIKKKKIKGIGFVNEAKRIYPGGPLASQTIGFTDIDSKGIAGLERFYEKTLGGHPGEIVAEHDPRGRTIPGGVYMRRAPVSGKDVQLTIDKDIQYRTEKAIHAAVKARKADAVSAIVMEIKTGEILAVASAPDFDPNIPKTRKQEFIRNRALTDLYEPGSTFKTAIIAAAIEEKIVHPSNRFWLKSRIKVGDKHVGEAHGRAARFFTVSEIIAESSNVGAVTIGQKMGKQDLYDWVTKWGFASSTGIDFPGEGIGFLPKPKDWSATTIGNVPIGQGVAISPLALVRAVAAMGNEGVAVTPRLTRSVGGKLNRTRSPKRIISSETADQMMTMLEKAVYDGTGSDAAVAGYRTAGKTGTAQKARTNGRGYGEGEYIGSFVGLLPASDPQIAIVVIVDEPRAGYYGGVVAAPVFKEIGEFTMRILRIAPDQKDPPDSQPSRKDT